MDRKEKEVDLRAMLKAIGLDELGQHVTALMQKRRLEEFLWLIHIREGSLQSITKNEKDYIFAVIMNPDLAEYSYEDIIKKDGSDKQNDPFIVQKEEVVKSNKKKPPIIEDLINPHEENQPTRKFSLAKQNQNSEPGIKKHLFFQSLTEILLAIKNNQKLDDIDVAEQLLNPDFRFISYKDPQLSRLVSDVIADTLTKYKISLSLENSSKATQKRKENADEFATKIYDVIEKIKQEEKITSYRETAKILNERHIKTYKGGNWHIKTLQDLNKRWQELGIISIPKPK